MNNNQSTSKSSQYILSKESDDLKNESGDQNKLSVNNASKPNDLNLAYQELMNDIRQNCGRKA